MMYRTLLALSMILLIGAQASAQKIEDLMGRAFNDDMVQSFMAQLQSEPIESFIPFRRSYKLSFKQDGIEMEFNSDLSLYQVNLYDSGYNFSQFKHQLPYEAFWGVDSVSLQTKKGIMKQDERNVYVKYYQNQNFHTKFYFRDGGLEHMRLIATNQLLTYTAEDNIKAWGLRLLPDGIKVKGNVVDGEGVMVWGKAAQYSGEWSYGLPHGVGEYRDSFGNVYAGEFKLGFFWGAGTYISKSFAYTYNGMFIMGRRHGNGEIKYGNGVSYKGEFFRDMMHGKGQYILTKENYYQGEMYMNNFHGKGTLTTSDGYIKGRFKNGKPHGYCEQFSNQSGQKLSGYWKDGMKQGEFTLTSFGYDRTVIFKDDKEVFPEEQ